MDKSVILKTAFNTENGHGQKRTSDVQRVMANILRGLVNNKCLAYLDDTIIFSTHLQQHTKTLRLVFVRFSTANFHIQIDKYEF